MSYRRAILKAGGAFSAGALIAAGTQVFPVRTHLYDVRLVNRRPESISVDLRLDADDETALRLTVDLAPSELFHVPCEWPRAAWSYRMAVRPDGYDDWETVVWDRDGKLCPRISIDEAGASYGPVSFYVGKPCPMNGFDHSCE